MLSKVLHHPFLWLSWGVSILGIILIRKHLPRMRVYIHYDKPGLFLFEFILLAIAVGGCMYLSVVFGDVVLRDIGLGQFASGGR